MICLRMRKTYTAKTPSSDFKVTTSENPLLSKQAVTSKGILVLYTNLQLNPYPNTQLDLFYSDNFSFQCTAPNTWLTNCADPSSSVHLFITRWRLWSCLVTKPYGVQTQQLLEKNEELWQTRFPVTLLHSCEIYPHAIVHKFLQPLK